MQIRESHLWFAARPILKVRAIKSLSAPPVREVVKRRTRISRETGALVRPSAKVISGSIGGPLAFGAGARVADAICLPATNRCGKNRRVVKFRRFKSLQNVETEKELAEKLCRAALAWVKTFQVCTATDSAALPEAVFEETAAYGMCLLELRLSPANAAGAEAFLANLRHECAAIKGRWQGRVRGGRRQLRPPQLPGEPAAFVMQYQKYSAPGSEPFRMTDDLFQDFCQITGLGSNVLVGKGPNLATLVFYIVLHGLFSANGDLSREQKNHLLRAAKSCHNFFEEEITRWLARSEPGRFPAALPPGVFRRDQLEAG